MGIVQCWNMELIRFQTFCFVLYMNNFSTRILYLLLIKANFKVSYDAICSTMNQIWFFTTFKWKKMPKLQRSPQGNVGYLWGFKRIEWWCLLISLTCKQGRGHFSIHLCPWSTTVRVCEIFSSYQKHERHTLETKRKEKETKPYNDITQSGIDLSPSRSFLEQERIRVFNSNLFFFLN